MDVTVLLVAFGLGFVAVRLGLPPLVGYLAAGFALHALGYEITPTIEAVSELGVLLLLFGIGLKLDLRILARAEVWRGASLHLVGASLLAAGLLLALGATGLTLATGLDPARALLIGFALSFSSTVFAVKALEERNETASLAGRLAVGILVMQDLFAVVFITLAAGQRPSAWAPVVLVAVIALRPLSRWLLAYSGHGELQVLLGFVLALGLGAGAFELVGLKPDLGALIVGLSLAGERRAGELSERLLGFKDLLLVGFFLSIGLGGAPSAAALLTAGLLLLLLPLKTAGFLWLLARFRLRSRTALHAGLTLASFSEFGLIVAAAGLDRGWLGQDWVSAIAVAVAASFALAAPANLARYALYDRWSEHLQRLERHPIQADDALIDPGDARVLVFGMGRVGRGAYDELVRRHGGAILGVDRSDRAVAEAAGEDRRVIRGDALDRDFWERVCLHPGIELVVLAMSDHEANLEATRRVREFLPGVCIAATAGYADEVRALEAAGVDVARNLFGEAGQGLADDALDVLGAPPG